MPPFTYESYRNPYSGSIGELLSRAGDPYARAAEQIAAAQARAAEARGQAWAQGAGAVGNAVNQFAQYQMDAPKREMQATDLSLKKAQLTEVQQGQQFRSTLSKILKDTPQLTEDGVSVYDIPSVAKRVTDEGFGQYAGDIAKSLGGLNDDFRKQRAATLALVQRGAQEVIRTGNDPEMAMHFLDQLERNQTFPKEQLQRYRAFIDADPANVQKLTAALAGPEKLASAAAGSLIYNAETGAPKLQVPEKSPNLTPEESFISEVEREIGGKLTAEQRLVARTKWSEAGADADMKVLAKALAGVTLQAKQQDLAAGDIWVKRPDGSTAFVKKTDVRPGDVPFSQQSARPSTGAEKQVLAYFLRAKDSIDTISAGDASGTSLEDRVAKSGIIRQGQLQYLPNVLQTPEQQAYRQAQRAFTEARLRKESGAAIPPHEYENDSKTYFAQPGDTPSLIDQKRKARAKVLEGLKFSSGKAYEEFFGEGVKPPARGTGSGAPSQFEIISVK